MKRLGNLTLILAIVAALANLGCYDWVAIRPTALPDLNGSTAVQVGTSHGVRTDGTVTSSPVIAVTQTAVPAPDGRMVQIEGDFDARVLARGMPLTTFRSPVVSEIVDDSLVIRSGSHAPARVPVASVSGVEVSQYNALRSTFLAVGLGLLIGGVGSAIAIGSI